MSLSRWCRTPGDRGKVARGRAHRPSVESLEARVALSLGAESQVNNTTTHDQGMSDSAFSANHWSVVVWRSEVSTKPPRHDILAQVYTPYGLKGAQITVARGAADAADESEPAVAVDDFGDFVVTWTRAASPGNPDVMARRFTETGKPMTPAIAVAKSGSAESQPDVASDASGNFIVAYTQGGVMVMAHRYLGNGQMNPINGSIGVAVPLYERAFSQPSVGMTSDGRFDVAFKGDDWNNGTSHIYLSAYRAWGSPIPFASNVVDGGGGFEHPSVAMYNDGRAVIAYNAGGHLAVRRYLVIPSAPVYAGGSVAPGTRTSVAVNQRTYDFVVAYETQAKFKAPEAVTVLEATQSGTSFHSWPAGKSTDPGRGEPSISMDPTYGNFQGNYLLTYTTSDAKHSNVKYRFGIAT